MELGIGLFSIAFFLDAWVYIRLPYPQRKRWWAYFPGGGFARAIQMTLKSPNKKEKTDDK